MSGKKEVIEGKEFGEWGIPHQMFEDIKKVLPVGRTILELGSGPVSTQFLSKDYKMISIEQNRDYVGKFDSEYIHAEFDKGINWYDIEAVRTGLEGKTYDMILVDGPIGGENRKNMMAYLDLFKLEGVIVVFDDQTRRNDRELKNDFIEKTGKQIIVKTRNYTIVK